MASTLSSKKENFLLNIGNVTLKIIFVTVLEFNNVTINEFIHYFFYFPKEKIKRINKFIL